MSLSRLGVVIASESCGRPWLSMTDVGETDPCLLTARLPLPVSLLYPVRTYLTLQWQSWDCLSALEQSQEVKMKRVKIKPAGSSTYVEDWLRSYGFQSNEHECISLLICMTACRTCCLRTRKLQVLWENISPVSSP